MRLGVWSWALVLAFATVSPDDSSPAGEIRPPVPLRKPVPHTPVETAGTGLSPSVGVRVYVDERGRVWKSQVLNIRPSTRFDALFERAALEAMADWRFAPALIEGKPVPRKLEWTIQFPPRERQTVQWKVNYRSIDSHLEYLRTIHRQPLDQRAAFLDHLVRKAESHLAAANRTEAGSSRFVAVTDAPMPGVASKVISNLEATYSVARMVLGGKVPPHPNPDPVRAYVFSTKQGYYALANEVPALSHGGGLYSPPGLIAFHLEQTTNEQLVAVMVHEAAFAFLDRHLMRSGGRFPFWLAEGFAQYLANSEIRDGRLVPGSHRQFQVFHADAGAWREESLSQRGAAEVKKAVLSGEALPLEDLIATRSTDLYGSKGRLFFTQSWMLVHFLRHGREGWEDGEFPRFVLGVAEGYDPARVFEATYGGPAPDFEEEFRRYVAKF